MVKAVKALKELEYQSLHVLLDVLSHVAPSLYPNHALRYVVASNDVNLATSKV